MKIFFNSSMPRSGSTLLQNILGNHPEIYATPTSGLFDFLEASKKAYTMSPAVRAQDGGEMAKSFLMYCKFGLHGYFHGLTDKPYVIDKSRAWAVNKHFLECFYPDPKIICMVRDLRDIVASMEKNFRKHPTRFSLPPEKNNQFKMSGTSVSERVTIWMGEKSKPVGETLTNLRDVIIRGFDKDILFIRLEDLTAEPQKTLNKIHKYLGIPLYKYDFDNIQQVTHEDDRFHGIYGDHKIKPVVKPGSAYSLPTAREILGDDLCDKLYDRNKWYFDYFNYR